MEIHAVEKMPSSVIPATLNQGKPCLCPYDKTVLVINYGIVIDMTASITLLISLQYKPTVVPVKLWDYV
jgi:hypothetical protein